MKKSTILIVSLFYVISILAVGLYGVAVRAYDSKKYVESIEIYDPDDGATGLKKKTPNDSCDYYYNVSYVDGLNVRLEARVLPGDTTYKELTYLYDENSTVFNLSIENTTINIHFNKKGAARFTAESTDGNKVQTRVLVIAM